LSLCAWGSPQFTGSDSGGPAIGPPELALLQQEKPQRAVRAASF
jgi:hypothetical protein